MTKIRDLLDGGRTFSFEFFPPRTDEAARELEKTIGELEPLHPSFVSVTYGAGGSTRERTRDVVVHIERDTGITAMAHLTCIAHTREQLVSLLEEYRAAGIQNILALAGDPPTDTVDFPHDLTYALELVRLIREVGDFSIGVAAHPELHPRSSSRDSDRRHLAEKLVEADFGITQFFFEAEPYLRMIDELAALGCTTPVLPGIMPVTNAKQVQRFAQLAGAAFPPHLAARFAAVADDPVAVRALGVEIATDLCRTLLDAGVPGLHFYTLNRSPATREVYANLGLS
ncbi:MAG: methylenetetrahydrofolate reductase [NAD(P)H] [Acidimicrobiales bacterium]|jgi:methylenetetrahydrofolate reductase (NADPH)|nr:methylenetetrahydrofolate reductase [NAD(P)H] [Acidimicrobiales bacterium]